MSDQSTWGDTFLTGIDQIDEQHKRLFNLAANLNNAARNGASIKTIGTLFSVINNFVINHFETEENLIENDKNYSAHCLEHYQFLKQLRRYALNWHVNKTNQSEPGQFLHNWLKIHIVDSDQPHLKEKQEKRPGSRTAPQPTAVNQRQPSQNERRNHPRLTPVSFGKEEITSHCFNATKSITGLADILNISGGGIKLSSATRHRVGDILFINCKLTENDDRINEKVKIMNTQPLNSFGAKFITPKQQTLNLIKQFEK